MSNGYAVLLLPTEIGAPLWYARPARASRPHALRLEFVQLRPGCVVPTLPENQADRLAVVIQGEVRRVFSGKRFPVSLDVKLIDELIKIQDSDPAFVQQLLVNALGADFARKSGGGVH